MAKSQNKSRKKKEISEEFFSPLIAVTEAEHTTLIH